MMRDWKTCLFAKTNRIAKFALLLPLASCMNQHVKNPMKAQVPKEENKAGAGKKKDWIVLGKDVPSSGEDVISGCMMRGDGKAGTLFYGKKGEGIKTRRGLLDPGEEPIEVVCRNEDILILSRTLLVAYNDPAGQFETYGDGTSIADGPYYVPREIRTIMARGFVSFAYSDDRAFILTLDKNLAVVPLGEEGDALSFSMPEADSGARIIFHKGMLFLGTRKEIVANIIDGEDLSFRRFRLDAPPDRVEFSERNGGLVFGKKRRYTIEVDGKTMEEIKIK